MQRKPSRRIPEEKAASPNEVHAAIEALAPAELLKLKAFARWRVRGLGRKAGGRTPEDLLGDAISATLAGDRRWNKAAVDFVGHLMGAVRSISNHWGRQFDPDEPALESELTRTTAEGEVQSPFARIKSKAPDAESALAAKQQVEQIVQMFADDMHVSLIIDGLRENMTGPEMQAALGISKSEYDAAMKRMRRTVRAIAPEGGRDA